MKVFLIKNRFGKKNRVQRYFRIKDSRIFATLKINHITQKTMKEQVLQAMREAGKPVSAGDVTKALNADRKEIDKVFAELKKEGAIVSPVRCKWEPAK